MDVTEAAADAAGRPSHWARDQQQWKAASTELIAGCIAGAANVTSGYPFDTLKVRLQASNTSSGMMDCFWSIWRTDGMRGLFRGVSSPLIGGAAETGVNYMVYSRLLDAFKAPGDALPPLAAVPAAGAAAGVALSVILAPTELLKCRSQMAHQPSPLACLRQLLQQEGTRGVTRGFGATLVREIPGNALFFTVYEALRRALPGRPLGHGNSSSSSSGSSSVWQASVDAAKDAGSAILCGGLAGTVMWSIILPLDVAKTRIQTATPGSPWDVGVAGNLRLLWREGGVSSLWRGLTPTLVRAFPANACQWLAWEVAIRHLTPATTAAAITGAATSGATTTAGAAAATTTGATTAGAAAATTIGARKGEAIRHLTPAKEREAR